MSKDDRAMLRQEAQRVAPDYICYLPHPQDADQFDAVNQHFLVFEGPNHNLMTVWTQCNGAQKCINRLLFSHSEDDGVTWAEPQRIAGPPTDRMPPYMASWGFPMVSKAGRIYVVWNQNQGIGGRVFMHTGTMAGRYSDDNGRTWSEQQEIPIRWGPFDDPQRKTPPQWIVWQKPMRDLQGGYFVGYTHWFHKSAARYPDSPSCSEQDSVVEFMRFTNIDAHPEPKDLEIRYSAWGDKALRVPNRWDPYLSIAQEPSLVRLPDDRLFCVMRTDSGYIWYSLSDDDGETWCDPRPLRRKDHGQPILQSVTCCPIYQLADGRYVLLHHNHPGLMKPGNPSSNWRPRRPAYLALGEFRPDAEQPIWFSQSKEFADPGHHNLGGLIRRPGQIGVYSSFTTKGGNNVLWDCDRKFFLYGKKVTDAFLSDMTVPEK